jgi:hypothetical protein
MVRSVLGPIHGDQVALAFATLVEYAVIVVVAIDVIRAAFLADQFSAFWAPIQRGTIAVTEKAFQFGPLLAHFVCSDWLTAAHYTLSCTNVNHYF